MKSHLSVCCPTVCPSISFVVFLKDGLLVFFLILVWWQIISVFKNWQLSFPEKFIFAQICLKSAQNRPQKEFYFYFLKNFVISFFWK